ncbi:MAG: CPBP family glutamic-type intramembrane protease [Cyanobacteria bacterium J06554_11]
MFSFQRAFTGLRTFPSHRGWLESVGYAAFVIAAAVVIAPSMVEMSQRPPLNELIRVGAIAFFIPSLAEEVVFRGLLLPEVSPPWLLLSLSAYVLWHPVEALTFLPEAAAIFLDVQFLLIVIMLGALCTVAYIRTGSLWASVCIHWWVVVAWKVTGGGGFFV